MGVEESDLLTWLAAVSVLLALAAAARVSRPGRGVPHIERALESSRAPVVAGVATALFLTWIWGSWSEPSFIHDEAAYRLQAELFASLRLSGPPPPLPEFFEQYHVLLTPRLAPKYPPGHALLLAPGVLIGWPGLAPVALYGLAAGLLFALAREVSGPWVGLLTWLVWLSAPLPNLWRATYLSQSTSTAVWLLGAWLLHRWWKARRPRDLVGLAVLVGWMGITRPVTAVAFAAPLGVLVLAGSWRPRGLRPLAAATLAGAAVLALLPVWAKASTGDWRTLPYTWYSRVYFPYEKLGFGVEPAPPLRELPPDMLAFDDQYRRVHAGYTPGRVPLAFVERLTAALGEFWGAPPWRGPLLLAFVVGLVSVDRRGAFAASWALAPFLVYLVYAHDPRWAVYYSESHAVLAYLSGLGLWTSLKWLAVGARTREAEAAARLGAPAAALGVLVLAFGLLEARTTRSLVHARGAYHRAFARAVAAIPERRAIVFVRYHGLHNPHRSLVENPPDHATARVWLARDRGADNGRLLALAPDRTPYLFDEASWTLVRLGGGA